LLYYRRSASKDEGEDKQDQKDDEQDVGDPRGFPSNTAEPKEFSDDSDYNENNCPA
jgi:hypothetical protein